MMITFPKTQIDYHLLQKSKLGFQNNSRGKGIYHYTSISGLEGILKNKKLRFTNIKYMNDKDEIVAGLDSIAKASNASDEERTKNANICVLLFFRRRLSTVVELLH